MVSLIGTKPIVVAAFGTKLSAERGESCPNIVLPTMSSVPMVRYKAHQGTYPYKVLSLHPLAIGNAAAAILVAERKATTSHVAVHESRAMRNAAKARTMTIRAPRLVKGRRTATSKGASTSIMLAPSRVHRGSTSCSAC